jgi:hypothetical protein
MPRLTHLVWICCLVCAAHPVAASDKCQKISDVVGQAALGKPAIVATLKKKPEKGTLGEPWRYLWFIHGKDLEAPGVSSEEQQSIFKTIVALNFSTNTEVNYDIFREYYYLRCKRKERGLSTIPLASISPASLTGCWNRVGSRPEFQACMEKLLGPSDAPGGNKRK